MHAFSGRPPLAGRLAALTGWRRWGLAAGLGVLAALAMPPIHAIPLLWISFPGLVWLIDGARRDRGAFAAGWCFGFGHFAVGFYWIAHAFLVDAERFGWLIPFAIGGLGAGMGLFIGAAALAARRLAAPGVARVLMLAAAWTLLEWVRSWLLTGFPWNPLGSVWMPVLPVVQVVTLIGTFGLSLLTVVVAAMPAVLAWPGRNGRRAVAASLVLLAAVAAWGAWRMPAGPMPTVPGVRLRLVQANIEQTLKWSPELRVQHFRQHLALSTGPGFDKLTTVVWSETAAPSFFEQDPEARRAVALAVPKDGLLLTGVVRGTPPDIKPVQIWNSLVAIDGRGNTLATYDKAHLVPFGEYMPLRDILPLKKITVGSIDFSAGPGPVTLDLPGLPPVAPMICYEAIFPGAVVDRSHRPGWLLNVTNDGWFGDSAGPYQHLAAARLRAVEEGLPLVRAANTGISAVVDPYGRIVDALPLGQQGVLDSDLPISLSGISLFARFGNWIALVLAAVTAAAAFALRRVSVGS